MVEYIGDIIGLQSVIYRNICRARRSDAKDSFKERGGVRAEDPYFSPSLLLYVVR